MLEKVTSKGRWLAKEDLYQKYILILLVTGTHYPFAKVSFGTKNIKGYLVCFNKGSGPLSGRNVHIIHEYLRTKNIPVKKGPRRGILQ